MTTELKEKKCVPCSGGVPKLDKESIQKYLQQVEGWNESDDKIHKRFKFKNFVEAIQFVNNMADVAEQEGHHPDFCVHYNLVDVTIWTHKINGLTESDFVLAAKLDDL